MFSGHIYDRSFTVVQTFIPSKTHIFNWVLFRDFSKSMPASLNADVLRQSKFSRWYHTHKFDLEKSQKVTLYLF